MTRREKIEVVTIFNNRTRSRPGEQDQGLENSFNNRTRARPGEQWQMPARMAFVVSQLALCSLVIRCA